MNDVSITRKSSAAELDAMIKRDADGGPIVTRDGYTVISPADWSRLVQVFDNAAEARKAAMALAGGNELEGGSLDELRRRALGPTLLEMVAHPESADIDFEPLRLSDNIFRPIEAARPKKTRQRRT